MPMKYSLLTFKSDSIMNRLTENLFYFLIIQSLATWSLTYSMDIVQTAIQNGNFKTLVAALYAADLVPTLKSSGPFTVFAPTDAAFQKLPTGRVEELLKPSNKGRLAQILKYHVIAGASLSSANINSLPLPLRLKSLEGRGVHISRFSGQIRIDNANVIAGNVHASNGVIHVIDSVLLPNIF